MHYQAPDNSLHFVEPDMAHLLPAGSVPITDEEADAIRAAVPAPVPAVITMRQARLALLGAGLLASVDAAIAAMTGTAGDAARIEWEFAATVERTNALFITMATQLGLTSQQLDDLFTAAAQL